MCPCGPTPLLTRSLCSSSSSQSVIVPSLGGLMFPNYTGCPMRAGSTSAFFSTAPPVPGAVPGTSRGWIEEGRREGGKEEGKAGSAYSGPLINACEVNKWPKAETCSREPRAHHWPSMQSKELELAWGWGGGVSLRWKHPGHAAIPAPPGQLPSHVQVRGSPGPPRDRDCF